MILTNLTITILFDTYFYTEFTAKSYLLEVKNPYLSQLFHDGYLEVMNNFTLPDPDDINT